LLNITSRVQQLGRCFRCNSQEPQNIEIACRSDKMRKAAGILLMIYGVRTIVLAGGFLNEQGIEGSPLVVGLVAIISAVFGITGGVFCLKSKYWKLCFASSIVLLLFMIFEVLFRFPFTYWLHLSNLQHPWVSIAITIPWPIISQIFVCLGRSEWQEISA